MIRINGKTAGGFSFNTIVPEYPYAIWMPQPIFLQALVEKAGPFTSFQCWMGAKATELIEEGDTITGIRGLHHGEQPFEIRADVVVGADGRSSSMRRLGHFEIEYEYHDFDVIWFVIEQPPDWPNTIYFSLGSDVRGLMLPKYPQQIQAGLFLPTGAWRDWRDTGIAAVAERVRGLDPVFADFADSLRDFRPFSPLAGQITLVKDWARDGFVLIGDSAHTMSPAGAIGVNVALATAAVAAQELYPLLGHGPIAHEDLAAIQQLREGMFAPCTAFNSAPSVCSCRNQVKIRFSVGFSQSAAAATALAPPAPRAASTVLRRAPPTARSGLARSSGVRTRPHHWSRAS